MEHGWKLPQTLRGCKRFAARRGLTRIQLSGVKTTLSTLSRSL